jgi:hypothetical protein
MPASTHDIDIANDGSLQQYIYDTSEQCKKWAIKSV